jgi:hypothetical protein
VHVLDFCEPDYISQFFVAEPYNAASSMIFTFFGFIGLIYCNPTQELRFSLLSIIAIVIGVGSTALHSTLHWFFQSLDEVPMLWFNMVCCYCILNVHTRRHANKDRRVDISACIFFFATFVETFIYYSWRSLYIVFILMYALSLAVVVLWSINYIFGKDSHKNIRNKILKLLLKYVFISFFMVGFVSWLVDMNFCSHLLPYYLQANGFTLHVLWHLGAGYGGYIVTVIVALSRCVAMEVPVDVKWMWMVIPILEKKKEDKKVN